ncbi:hypothetical protein WICPIJ_004086 [Wickerhamomyces pijperi]|uniref:Uncharacterized protein n=1 Tax=Wickerhamomyces pijperi TaxID=599730 RepID=A0A9P8Q8N6_WICPI|nr:hypothetical protein WICPIJ_004086 [Wickerhamomyces pijperi]
MPLGLPDLRRLKISQSGRSHDGLRFPLEICALIIQNVDSYDTLKKLYTIKTFRGILNDHVRYIAIGGDYMRPTYDFANVVERKDESEIFRVSNDVYYVEVDKQYPSMGKVHDVRFLKFPSSIPNPAGKFIVVQVHVSGLEDVECSYVRFKHWTFGDRLNLGVRPFHIEFVTNVQQVDDRLITWCDYIRSCEFTDAAGIDELTVSLDARFRGGPIFFNVMSIPTNLVNNFVPNEEESKYQPSLTFDIIILNCHSSTDPFLGKFPKPLMLNSLKKKKLPLLQGIGEQYARNVLIQGMRHIEGMSAYDMDAFEELINSREMIEEMLVSQFTEMSKDAWDKKELHVSRVPAANKGGDAPAYDSSNLSYHLAKWKQTPNSEIDDRLEAVITWCLKQPPSTVRAVRFCSAYDPGLAQAYKEHDERVLKEFLDSLDLPCDRQMKAMPEKFLYNRAA